MLVAPQRQTKGRQQLAFLPTCCYFTTKCMGTLVAAVNRLPCAKCEDTHKWRRNFRLRHPRIEGHVEATMDRETAAAVFSFADRYQRGAPRKSCKILVADGDRSNQKLLVRQLEMAGHPTKVVADGEQALDAFDQAEADFDVVILDSDMPVMSALETARLISVMQAGRRSVPIIMLSADATPKAILEATAAGVNVVLRKPVETNTLFAAIAQFTAQPSKRMAKVVPIFAPPQPA